ncbi:tail fiber protein [Flavobacterium sp. HTF]|uniref:tail fiber protein n=1 Tax=Flavobacterium sp. HTF TaxID=2170732 RepID=UPI000D5D2C7C|nr:tail fiber protein [Flavobacterium sp. HTF]PWB18331.1 hypothetical protein DCO46_22445 [Flavobacterium sp. HTF]
MKKVVFLIVVICNTAIYSQTFDGNLALKSLKWTTEQKDFNSAPRTGVDPMSMKLWDNYGGVGAPSTYGSLLEIYGKSAHLISQMYFDNTWNGSRILYRTSFYGQTTWESWRYLLDSKSDVASSGSLKIDGKGNSYVLGNLGIGTTTTGVYKLAVEGAIGAREVKVMATGWADFVFKKEYELPTLEDVEKHINEKGHLRNIPTEAEVLKDGISLGEMNVKLLQKIEELTLYVIEQNKKITNLENRFEKMEAACVE